MELGGPENRMSGERERGLKNYGEAGAEQEPRDSGGYRRRCES